MPFGVRRAVRKEEGGIAGKTNEGNDDSDSGVQCARVRVMRVSSPAPAAPSAHDAATLGWSCSRPLAASPIAGPGSTHSGDAMTRTKSKDRKEFKREETERTYRPALLPTLALPASFSLELFVLVVVAVGEAKEDNDRADVRSCTAAGEINQYEDESGSAREGGGDTVILGAAGVVVVLAVLGCRLELEDVDRLCCCCGTGVDTVAADMVRVCGELELAARVRGVKGEAKLEARGSVHDGAGGAQTGARGRWLWGQRHLSVLVLCRNGSKEY
ncbi:hypothetical protein C8F04DRAFT_1187468 [Mycena alexandri]|uniref:Uncharacterized protein n=1 Tax=Mycena alexandri TaxID=1745969 RepID=A0AAD6WYR1_9AGAR|nr:hypothetical protein C8F04DRAFT_1187468 [Mycena alexandri]